jgi:site-specific DNA-methyltransferase (adenine-specific)
VQKPVGLLKLLIEKSTNSGEIVLDPFAGAGSTAIAAREVGRRYLAFEIDDRFYRDGLKLLTEKK